MAREIKIAIVGDSRQFTGATRDADRALGTLNTRLGGVSSTIGKLGKIAAVGLGGVAVAGAAGLSRSLSDASNQAESLSKVRTIFDDNAKSIEDFASKSAGSIGLSKSEALDATGTFGNMFDQLGIGSKQSAGLSTSMVNLAADLGSFHNADITDVIDAQSSAFRGEYDALQRYIPTINAAAVEQEALRATGKKTTKELTLQDKALAVQALMMKGAGEAAGDFKRTSGGLANQQRILKAKLADASAEIGSRLLPVVTKITSWFADQLPGALDATQEVLGSVGRVLSKNVVPAVKSAAQWVGDHLVPKLQALFGFLMDHKEILVGVAAAIAVGLVAAFLAWAEAAAMAAAATVLATWPIIAIGVAIAALVAGVIYAYKHWGWFRDAVDAVARFLTGTLFPIIVTVTDWLRNNLAPAVGNVAAFFGDTLFPAVRKVTDFIRERVLPTIARIISAFVDTGADAWNLAAAIRGAFADIAHWIRVKIDEAHQWIDRLLGPLDEIIGKLGKVSGLTSGGGGAFGVAKKILGFNSGGVIPGPVGKARLVVAHGGETVLPTHKRGVSVAVAASEMQAPIHVSLGKDAVFEIIVSALAGRTVPIRVESARRIA